MYSHFVPMMNDTIHRDILACLFHVTLLTTGRTDSQHLTSLTSFCHTGSGLHVSAGPTIILVVIHSRIGSGNRQESCGVIKGLSLASLNSLAPCWRRAYSELMGLGRGKRGKREEERGGEKLPNGCVFGAWFSYTCEG